MADDIAANVIAADDKSSNHSGAEDVQAQEEVRTGGKKSKFSEKQVESLNEAMRPLPRVASGLCVSASAISAAD